MKITVWRYSKLLPWPYYYIIYKYILLKYHNVHLYRSRITLFRILKFMTCRLLHLWRLIYTISFLLTHHTASAPSYQNRKWIFTFNETLCVKVKIVVIHFLKTGQKSELCPSKTKALTCLKIRQQLPRNNGGKRPAEANRSRPEESTNEIRL